MPTQSLIVLDDFYDDPDAVRALALSLDYWRKPGATYPGREAHANTVDWSNVWQRLQRCLDVTVCATGPKNPPFPQGKFRLALTDDEHLRIDGVHEDLQPWSGSST